jgi:hypothetical protein
MEISVATSKFMLVPRRNNIISSFYLCLGDGLSLALPFYLINTTILRNSVIFDVYVGTAYSSDISKLCDLQEALKRAWHHVTWQSAL